LSHPTLSRRDNQAGLRLLLADDILMGSGYARTTIRGLARWADMAPAEVLDAFAAFVATRGDLLSRQLALAFSEIDAECYFHRRLRSTVRNALFADRESAGGLLQAFVDAYVHSPAVRSACKELARYDAALLPRADLHGTGEADENLSAAFDTHAAGLALLSSAEPVKPPRQQPVRLLIRHRAGFAYHRGDAIDFSARWLGRVVQVSSTA
jgi:hypothetical protein